MDFGNKYLTYLEYKELGGEMSVSPFNVLEYEARKKIDERTQCRLVNFTPIPTQVKMCMFNLINIIAEKVAAKIRKKTMCKLGNVLIFCNVF